MANEVVTDPPLGTIYLPPGTMIGEFRVEQLLGEGGMATVYAATHTIIGKKAAVKVMSQKLCADPAAVERFVSEARAVNQIGHPNIVDAFAFGKLDDGRSYMVMEWLQGITLQERFEQGTMSLAETIDILMQITDALEAAHEKGIIHRDLKPDNIFLTKVRGRRTLVKLLDFGIAKLTSADLTQSKTKTGLFVGTPTHISPEQARSKNVDARTDIYALGVTAYQMVLGRLPFDADNAMDLVTMHLGKPPPAPSTIWPEVPPALEQLLMALLEKEMDKRPTLLEMQDVLVRLRDEYRLGGPGLSDEMATWAPLRSGLTPPPGPTPRPGGRTPTPSGVQRTISGVGPRHMTPPVGVPVRNPTPAPGAARTSGQRQAVHPLARTTPAGTPVYDPDDARAPTVPLMPALAEVTGPVKKLEPEATAPDDEVSLKPRSYFWPIAGGVGLLLVALVGFSVSSKKSPAPAPAPKAAEAVAPAPAAAPVAVEPGSAAEPVSQATLSVDINVPARVELDGEVVAENVQSAVVPVPKPGNHQLVVTAPKYQVHRAAIRTAGDEKLWLRVQLVPLGSKTAEKKTEAKPDPKAAKPGGGHGREYMLDPFGSKK